MFPIRLIPGNTSINFMRQKWLAFGLSIALMVLSAVLMLTKGLSYGIDFSGGVVIELRTEAPVELSKIRALFDGEDSFGEVSLQHFGSDNDIMIRFQPNLNAGESQQQAIDKVKTLLANTLNQKIEYRKVDYVGPQVGEELKMDAAIALGLAVVGIMIYIWLRFEWQYGVGAILALGHDAVLVLGLYSLLGLEFNLTSIAAILTILGYSINDSVVIYDRIRECLRKYKKMEMDELLNLSINQTLSRTVLTAGTTLVALVALIIWGGPVIRDFSVAIFFGIIIGTYSSVYISAPVLTFMNLQRRQAAA